MERNRGCNIEYARQVRQSLKGPGGRTWMRRLGHALWLMRAGEVTVSHAGRRASRCRGRSEHRRCSGLTCACLGCRLQPGKGIVERLLKAGADPGLGSPALPMSAERGDANAVDALLAAKANVNSVGIGRTALIGSRRCGTCGNRADALESGSGSFIPRALRQECHELGKGVRHFRRSKRCSRPTRSVAFERARPA
jgi:hypothetical protein